jgi:hypothetical protein
MIRKEQGETIQDSDNPSTNGVGGCQLLKAHLRLFRAGTRRVFESFQSFLLKFFQISA